MSMEHVGPATTLARGLRRLEPDDWRRIEAAAFHAEPEVLDCLDSDPHPQRHRRWLSTRRRPTALATRLAALPAQRLAAIREDLLRAIADLRNRQLIDDATAVRAAEAPPGHLGLRLSS
ncbi:MULTISPECIES: hypothetical protein [Microbacterium]|jgi:hypothetical protein|uniref:hypothetical protein n=1 Tax=Microbacterium TaxID=33882 RepID=UPI001E57ACA4|nr:hypothetical protein [Microbacterium nymphoidis]MCD2498242.1 hypothetical protein [Microbacterium nymphoidis]